MTSHNGHVDTAIGDNDLASCSESTPGGSRHCGVSVTTATVPTATFAVSPPPYDAVVDVSCEELPVTSSDQQVLVCSLTNHRSHTHPSPHVVG